MQLPNWAVSRTQFARALLWHCAYVVIGLSYSGICSPLRASGMRRMLSALPILGAARPDLLLTAANVIAAVLWLLALLVLPDRVVHHDKYRRIDGYRIKVEAHRHGHGRLPPSVDFSEEDYWAGFHYEVEGESYRLCFPIGFDDDICYASDKSAFRRWP
jgi:hypothetical protein